MTIDDISLVIKKICEAIALHEPFTLEEVYAGYLQLESVDDLLEKIETAKAYQESLLETIEKGRDPKGSIREVLNKKSFQPGPEKTTIGLGFDIRIKK
jgi:hypothetical protein